MRFEVVHNVPNLEAQLEAYDESASHRFQSQKAKVEGRITESILPRSVVLNRDILPAQDSQAIREAIEQATSLGYAVGVRTCYDPQPPNSAWVMGVITPDQVEAVMHEQIPAWQQDPRLTEIIVMHNPPGLGIKEERPHHSVMRVECQNDGLYFEARLHTDQLRSIEGDTPNADLIRGKILENSAGPCVVTVAFGENYTTIQSPLTIEATQQEFASQGVARLNGDLKPDAASAVQGLVGNLQRLCVDPHLRLGEKLEALANHGLEFTEWQAKTGQEGNVEWMKIYGLRGNRDDTHWR